MRRQLSSAAGVRGGSFYKRLFILYVLNLADWICTEALLATGRFYEANPLMKNVLGSFSLTFMVKGVLPLALTLLCAAVFRLAGVEETRFGNALLTAGIIAYSLVNLWHIVNFLLLFSVK